jgi:hypothetical protein
VANHTGSAVGGHVLPVGDTDGPLGSGKPEKEIRRPPEAELQALLTEYAVEHGLHNPPLLCQQGLAKWRLKPLLHGPDRLVRLRNNFCHMNHFCRYQADRPVKLILASRQLVRRIS